MKRVVIGILCALSLSVLSRADASSYPPQPNYDEVRQDKFIKGETLCLFHSGIDAVKTTIHPGDVLTVYRINRSFEMQEVGLIKVVSFVGDTYFKGVVVAGEIRPDDIARKGTLAALVISAAMCDYKE